jgi:hypothetical protein
MLQSSAAVVIDPRELPLVDPPEDVPLWSENYAWEIGSPDQSMGFFIHLSRQTFDPSVWRETFVAMLPDGKVAVSKSYGRGAHELGAGGAQLKISCTRSFEEWIIEFDGVARVVPEWELGPDAGGTLRDGPYVRFQARLESHADTPPWDLGAAIATHSWGKDHYQQAVHVCGNVTVQDQKFSFDGLGMRDHTRGPRDFGALGPWSWLSGGTAGGTRFIVLAMEPAHGTEQPPVKRAVIGDKNGLEPVTVLRNDLLDGLKHDANPIVELQRKNGFIDVIEVETTRQILLSPSAPNQLFIGPAPGAKIFSCQSPTRLNWNGQSSIGYLEHGRLAT